jgi:hypothetical protein
MTAIDKRPRRRQAAIWAALLAPLALLGARQAMRAAALRRDESRRASVDRGRAVTVRSTATSAASARVAPATAGVEAASVARAPVLPLDVSAAAGETRRAARTPRLVLAVASVALIGVFIQHAQSRVPRPTLERERPTNVSPATKRRLSPAEVAKDQAVMPRTRTRGGVSASPPPAPRRSGTQPRRQTLRQHHPKHQHHAAGLPSVHRPTQPVLPTKHARERPASPVHAAGGRALHPLRWNAVAGATYYNLVLWRNGKRVLDLWPNSPYVVVPTTSVNHAPQARLSPGRYLWFVYPGFGAKPARQYGALARSGVLVVQPKGGNDG